MGKESQGREERKQRKKEMGGEERRGESDRGGNGKRRSEERWQGGVRRGKEMGEERREMISEEVMIKEVELCNVT